MVLSPAGVIADILWHDIPQHSEHIELGSYVVMPDHVHGILILDKPSLGADGLGADGLGADGLGADSVGTDSVGTLHAKSPQTTVPQAIVSQRDLDSTEIQQLEEELADLDNLTVNQKSMSQRMSEISPKANTISAVVRSYKSAVTKHANRLGLENGWQSRFYDRIIRNHGEYERISNYIIANPLNWGKKK